MELILGLIPGKYIFVKRKNVFFVRNVPIVEPFGKYEFLREIIQKYKIEWCI